MHCTNWDVLTNVWAKIKKGTEQYNKIIANHKQSIYYRKALLQLGLINYNNNDFNKALTLYKEVAKNFLNHLKRQAALLGIKNCYIELNNVDAWFSYAKQTGTNISVSANEQDSLTFMAAERLYMAGDKNAASQLERYLQQFPNGGFALNSHFYLAESLYNAGKFTESNKHYKFVADQPDNIFTEQALSKSSELTFNSQNYAEMLEMFIRLEKIANEKWNILRAHVGQMRCFLILGNYEDAIGCSRKNKKI